MSIRESYQVNKVESNLFTFISKGKQGEILKGIVFEEDEDEKGRYNLAFGDIRNNDIDDEVVSNNDDLKVVISTVVKVVYYFFKFNREAIVEIEGVDERRTSLYNFIFRKRFQEIDKRFHLRGYDSEGNVEIYDSKKYYQKFEIQLKS